jgi:hypothetical protein
MVINVSKNTIISFTQTTNIINFNYKLCINLTLRSQSVKDVAVFMDCKLYFHDHTDYILSRDIKMLGYIQYVTSFSTTDIAFCFVYHTCAAQT